MFTNISDETNSNEEKFFKSRDCVKKGGKIKSRVFKREKYDLFFFFFFFTFLYCIDFFN